MILLIPISRANKLLKEAKSNSIDYSKVRPNIYSFTCDSNPTKVATFKRINCLFEV